MRKVHTSDHILTILLVEDNLAHAELVMRSFEDHKTANRIQHVTDGEAALNYLFRQEPYTDQEKYPRPNLILLDLRLPKVDGIEVLKRIRTSREWSTIPVIVLTTSDAESDVARAYEYRANSYLVKPLDFNEFTKQMDDMGFYWLGWNYYPS